MAGQLFSKLGEQLPGEVMEHFGDLSDLNDDELRKILKTEFSKDSSLEAMGIPEEFIDMVKKAIATVIQTGDLKSSPETGPEVAVNQLSFDDLETVYSAIISSGLAGSRRSLLTSIDPHYVAGLDILPNTARQTKSDLEALNKSVINGENPLITYLKNAIQVVGPRQELAIFKTALQKLQPPVASPAVNKPAQPVNNVNLRPIPSVMATEDEIRDDFDQISATQIHKPGNLLGQDMISGLSDALLEFNRSDLLSALPRPFVSSLQTTTAPLAQLLIDLHSLNRVKALGDKSDPLAIVLHTALRLSFKNPKNYYKIRLALRSRQDV